MFELLGYSRSGVVGGIQIFIIITFVVTTLQAGLWRKI